MGKQMKYIDYVHIIQGTNSNIRFSHGNTLPLTEIPFGMAAFAPQTRITDRGWFFNPFAHSVEGIRLTHQPSPWIGDFGSLVFMPQTMEDKSFDADLRWSGYRPGEAVLKPHYIKLGFLRSRSIFELTPTERGAVMRVNYTDKDHAPVFSIIKVEGDIEIKFDKEENRVYGYVNNTTPDKPEKENFKMYFVLEPDCGFSCEKSIIDTDGCHILLNSHTTEIRVATSYISYVQAKLNLKREVERLSFGTALKKAENAWEKVLSSIEIETDDLKLRDTFYTCLYRCFLFPQKMYELDENKNTIHYDPYTDTAKPGYMYTNNGFWDTYRTVYPLLSIIAPESNSEILKGFLQFFSDTGWLPRWHSLHDIDCMPGTLIDAVVADGAIKGLLTGDDLSLALKALRKHGECPPIENFGRKGNEFYLKHGYVPRSIKESINCTQDYAYGDFCIAQVARLLGEEKIAKDYEKRSKNYKNIFDAETGFMRSRDENGNMLPTESFDALRWGGDYTEGNAWQNSFSVPHDIEGLAELHGGKEKLIKKLDELFNTPPLYTIANGGYPCEIHEMTEMAAVDFGQFAISNQPSFLYPWLYAALGEYEKAEYWIQKTVSKLFNYSPDGFPGDEDNGAMAAWYVFAVLGFYPICPGTPKYLCLKPLVKKIKINGKELPDFRPGDNLEYKNLI